MKMTVGITALLLSISLGARSARATACTSTNCGIVFVHGTGDYTQSTAVSSYWTQSSIDTMRGSYTKYLVVGYPGATKAAHDSAAWGAIMDQIYDWSQFAGLSGIVVVSHSNGDNAIRYALVHGSAVTPKGRTVSTITAKIKKLIAVAGDARGTQLADSVTTSGSLLSIGNGLTSLFGSNWNNAAVWQQRRDRMGNCTSGGGCTGYNGDGTYGSSSVCYGGATACGGKPVETVSGSSVYAAVWSSDAYCGGYWFTAGLKATLIYGWGSGGCSDGFVPCDSAKYHGTSYQEDSKLNHNGSRRSCRGSGTTIKNRISSTTWTTAIPDDYTVAPGAQACDATTPGWFSADPDAGWVYQYGCTSTDRADTYTDHDCFAAYGGDNGHVAPADFSATAYADPYYYDGSVCPDSWLGDGECDMCLLAKYGYDSKDGSTTDDDCVNKGAGYTNQCADILYYDVDGIDGYYSYAWTH